MSPIDYSKAAVPALTPGTTEDCLFLDVRVSEAVFNARGTGKGAPVVVWIHGGGYTQGYKSQEGSGRGLILAGEQYNETGIVYVAINYRLGLFVRLLSMALVLREDSFVTSFTSAKKCF